MSDSPLPQPPTTSWVSPRLAIRPSHGATGVGVFAVEPMRAGDLLTMWSGSIYDIARFAGLSEHLQRRSIQVEEELYLVPESPTELPDLINHSCDPSAWVEGHLALRARRDIARDEEVTFDYATTDGTAYDEFPCDCRSPLCRKRVSKDDWKLPEVQARYAGHFMPYLQRWIDRSR